REDRQDIAVEVDPGGSSRPQPGGNQSHGDEQKDQPGQCIPPDHRVWSHDAPLSLREGMRHKPFHRPSKPDPARTWLAISPAVRLRSYTAISASLPSKLGSPSSPPPNRNCVGPAGGRGRVQAPAISRSERPSRKTSKRSPSRTSTR